MILAREDFVQLVELITPYLATPQQRMATVTSSFSDTPQLSSQIDATGSPHVFSTYLVTTLLNFGNLADGTPAIVRLLETISSSTGTDTQSTIRQLIKKIQAKPKIIDAAPVPTRKFTDAQLEAAVDAVFAGQK